MSLDGAMARLGAGLVRWGGNARAPRVYAQKWRVVLLENAKMLDVNSLFNRACVTAGNRRRVRTLLPTFPWPQTFSNLRCVTTSCSIRRRSKWWSSGRRRGDDAAHHEAAPGTEAK